MSNIILNVANKNVQSNQINNNRNRNSDSVDCDVVDSDTLSVADSNSSDCSDNVDNYSCDAKNNDLNFRHNDNSIDNIQPPNANIGSVCIENSTNVTFGNKTLFNGPVVIKNFVVDCNNVEADHRHNDKANQPGTKKTADRKSRFSFQSRSNAIFVALACEAALVLTITTAVYYIERVGNVADTSDSNTTSTTTEKYGDLELITRDGYGALQPKKPGVLLNLPIRQVVIAHTGTPNCTDHLACESRVRQIQQYHMNTFGWTDIGLNFVVGGDGRAYEGCGYTIGAHTLGYNKVSLCISFIGDFTTYEAPERQLRAAQLLIEYGVKLNKIDPNYVLYGQRQLRAFDSPGIMLYNKIMSWPHWSKEIIPL